MAIFKCKMCGGTLEINAGESVATCEYCGTKQTLPKLDDDKRATLYDRAGHFRRSNEFDKAMGIYEHILTEDPEDAEAYWSLVLCRYGIEYVEDPASHKRVPTVNRAQFTSVLTDENYQNALKYGSADQKELYEKEALAIDEIQKGILAISQKEEPFDVFICYKESDEQGRRTSDSVFAGDIYRALTKEGFKVFYARITLEDKLGTAYEPYIFAALNSAKVMIAVGTKKEYFEAVWVKNEWSRYLALMREGDKTLIPAYKDMDPYDLPTEFSYLQAQDMGKIGFMQDLIHGVEKLIGRKGNDRSGEAHNETEDTLKKAYQFLSAKSWRQAEHFLNTVLVSDPDNAEALVGLTMWELQCAEEGDLAKVETPLTENEYFKQAFELAEPKLKKRLKEYNYSSICNHCKQLAKSKKLRNLKLAIKKTQSISDWPDAKECADKFRKLLMKKRITRIVVTLLCLITVPTASWFAYRGVLEYQNNTRYNEIFSLYEAGEYALARQKAASLGDYKNSREIANRLSYRESYDQMAPGKYITFGGTKWSIASKENGKVLLISKDVIKAPFNETVGATITWKDSSLRAMLNGSFYEEKFSEDEKSLIQTTSLTTNGETTEDKVFIFSEEEIDVKVRGYLQLLDQSNQKYMARDVGEDAQSHCIKTIAFYPYKTISVENKDAEVSLRPVMYLDFNITKQ